MNQPVSESPCNQPNLELGRDRDRSEPIGTMRDLFFDSLSFDRPCVFKDIPADAGSFVHVADGKLNPGWPETTPRGGAGKVTFVWRGWKSPSKKAATKRRGKGK